MCVCERVASNALRDGGLCADEGTAERFRRKELMVLIVFNGITMVITLPIVGLIS